MRTYHIHLKILASYLHQVELVAFSWSGKKNEKNVKTAGLLLQCNWDLVRLHFSFCQ